MTPTHTHLPASLSTPAPHSRRSAAPRPQPSSRTSHPLLRALCVRFSALSAATLLIGLAAGCGSGGTPATPTPTLTVSGAALAAPMVGNAYNSALTISGGSGPYTCTVASGSLPTGLSIGAGCHIVGTPTAAGPFTATVSASDSSSPAATGSGVITMTVSPATLVFSSTSLTGVVNVAFSATLPVSGGTTPYSCTLTSGTLPTGLTIASGCRITGTPSVTGSTTVSIKAADQGGQTATASFTIIIKTSADIVLSAGLPVYGASVQVYAAGTAGNGSTPTALLASPITTDPTGAFNIDFTHFTCPSSSAIIYVVATGGAPGPNPANSGSVLISSPGACSNFNANASLTLNEATTAASAYAFAQFLAPGAAIGASSTNLTGLTLAAGTLANLVDTTSGAVPGPGFPATGTAPTAKLNLLATLISACINKAGAACTTFYADATPTGGTTPSNTLDAALNLVTHPSLNVSALYTLAGTEPVATYSPLPSTALSDWMLYIPFTGGGMSHPDTVAIDSKGVVWVGDYDGALSAFKYGTPVAPTGYTASGFAQIFGIAVDASDNIWVANQGGIGLGSVSILNNAGQSIPGSPFTNGPFDWPSSIAIDTNGNAWVVDYGLAYVTLLNSAAQPLSGSAGWASSQLVFPIAAAVDSKHNAWVVNQDSNAGTVTRITPDGSSFTSYTVGLGPSGVAVDQRDFVWTADFSANSIGLVSPTGTVVSGTGFTGGGLTQPESIAIDGAGNAWITNYRGPALTELAGSNATTPGAALSPSTGWASDNASSVEAYGIAIDQAGNAWVSSYYSNILYEYVGVAVPVKTPRIGPASAP